MSKDSQQSHILPDLIPQKNLPRHVAVIMDGNGRWATERKRPRIFGHNRGVERVRDIIQAACELNLKFLTLFAFSEENWGRPKDEVFGIMKLLDTFIIKERQELHRNNIRLRTIGQLDMLPTKTQKLLQETTEYLSQNDGLNLNIALSYGGRSEISHACKAIATKVKNNELDVEDIDAHTVESHLWSSSIPDPDLLIRTSGEQRISNFLLWQMAYCELWFSKVFWPDFHKEHFFEAIASYCTRNRRFGRLSTTLSSSQNI